MQRDLRNGDRGSIRAVAGVGVLVVFFVVMIVVVIALTFSVKVYGHSMDPTLSNGDRLVSNLFGRKDVHRFDLVQTRAGENGIEVVKRVIGMPGDRVAIRGGNRPAVFVRPAGSSQRYRVVNPAWTGRYGSRLQGCCTAGGKALSVIARTMHWITLGPDTYWLLGDNWGASDDSRVWGSVTKSMIGATLNFRLLPLSRFGHIGSNASLVPVAQR